MQTINHFGSKSSVTMCRYLQLKSKKKIEHWEKEPAKLIPAAALHWMEIVTFWLYIKISVY